MSRGMIRPRARCERMVRVSEAARHAVLHALSELRDPDMDPAVRAAITAVEGGDELAAHALGMLSRWLLGQQAWRGLWVCGHSIGEGSEYWTRLHGQARRVARAALEDFSGVSLPAVGV